MFHKPISYILDAFSGGTAVFGFITGNDVAIFFGVLASILAGVNHFQQILERKQKKGKP